MTNATNDTKAQSIKVAKVIDECTLVINKGANDGIKSGQRVLIYTYGDDVVDPDTRLVLGKLEIVKGTGRVTHLQEAIATIRSDMTASPSSSVRKIKRQNPWGSLLGSLGTEEVEEILPTKAVPFEKPEIGDSVKPI